MPNSINPIAEEIRVLLIQQHGPLIGGWALARSLGFVSEVAFRQARRRGTLGIPTFRIDGRRGALALTLDVANWVVAQAGMQSPAGAEGGEAA